MTLLHKIGYIVVMLCFVAWLYLLFIGQSNIASNITGATSFVSLLLSIFNPFDGKTKDIGRRNDHYWNGDSEDDYSKKAFRSIALGLALFLLIASLGFAVYPIIQSLTETINTSDSTKPYVEFRDEALDRAVHQAMGIDEGQPILLSQARSVEVLNLTDYSNTINDLTGISCFSSLEELYIPNNNISNIADLKNIHSLRILHLEINSIKDLKPLKGLTSLRDLDLANNKIQNIDALRNLTGLRMLDVSKNNISSIGAVKNMTGLQKLYISYNKIKDISSIKNLSKAYYLSMRNNNIENMDVLIYLPNLKILSICYNPLKSQGVILGLEGLDHLRISNDQFTSDQIKQLESNVNELAIE